MNWEAVGAIAEILGAVGVIATLIYLAAQIRQNTRQLRRSELNSTLEQANSIRRELLDPELARLVARSAECRADDLSPEDQVRLHALLAMQMWQHFNIWDRVRNGFVGSDQYAFESAIRVFFDRPATFEWWHENQQFFERDYVQAIDRILERRDSRPAQAAD